MSWIDMIGFAGSGFAIATYWMREMLALRLMAVLSCVCFIFYGISIGSYPLLAMEFVLLPINLFRLVQLLRPANAAASEQKGLIA